MCRVILTPPNVVSWCCERSGRCGVVRSVGRALPGGESETPGRGRGLQTEAHTWWYSAPCQPACPLTIPSNNDRDDQKSPHPIYCTRCVGSHRVPSSWLTNFLRHHFSTSDQISNTKSILKSIKRAKQGGWRGVQTNYRKFHNNSLRIGGLGLKWSKISMYYFYLSLTMEEGDTPTTFIVYF